MFFFFLLSAIGCWIWSYVGYRVGWYHASRTQDVEGFGQVNAQKAGTPTSAGVLLIALSSVALWCKPHLIVMAIMGMVGWYDDALKIRHNGISPRWKLFAQCLTGFFIWYYGTRHGLDWTQFHTPFGMYTFAMPALGMLGWSIFVVMATSNAVNLTDGIDGLAAVTLLGVCAFAASHGSTTASLFVAIIGGFLLMNGPWPRARVYMGDVGSLSLGGAIAAIYLWGRMELFLPCIGLIWVLETMSVIVQVVCYKLWRWRPLYCAPLHHHLQRCGWHDKSIYLAATFVQLILLLLIGG